MAKTMKKQAKMMQHLELVAGVCRDLRLAERIDQLLGQDGLTPEDLHDDCLGTALDALWEAGITETFYQIASGALRRFGIDHRFVHLDSTTFSLHGQYDQRRASGKPSRKPKRR